METSGSRVEEMLNFIRISRPGWYVNGQLLKRAIRRAMQLKVVDLLVWLWRRIDQRLTWPPASFIAIAVKV